MVKHSLNSGRHHLLAFMALLLLVGCAGQRSEPAPTATIRPRPGTATAQPSATSERPAEPSATPTPAVERVVELLAQPYLLAYIDAEGYPGLATPEGRQLRIWEEQRVVELSWSPDGQVLALLTDRQELLLWSPEQTRQLASDASGPISWSADGKLLAVTTNPDELEPTLTLIERDSGAQRELGQGFAPHFAPSGQSLLAGHRIGAAEEIREGYPAIPALWNELKAAPIVIESAAHAMSWSRVRWNASGTLAAVANILLSSDGQIVQRFADPRGGQLTTSGISPNGRWVALATLAVAGAPEAPFKTTELAIYDSETGNRQSVWLSEAEPGQTQIWQISPVVWSPDSTILAFIGAGQTLGSAPVGGAGVWMGTVDGSELAPLPGSAGATQELIFSPDGAFLSFTRGSAEDRAIWLWKLDGSAELRQLLVGSAPVWKP